MRAPRPARREARRGGRRPATRPQPPERQVGSGVRNNRRAKASHEQYARAGATRSQRERVRSAEAAARAQDRACAGTGCGGQPWRAAEPGGKRAALALGLRARRGSDRGEGQASRPLEAGLTRGARAPEPARADGCVPLSNKECAGQLAWGARGPSGAARPQPVQGCQRLATINCYETAGSVRTQKRKTHVPCSDPLVSFRLATGRSLQTRSRGGRRLGRAHVGKRGSPRQRGADTFWGCTNARSVARQLPVARATWQAAGAA